MIDVVMDRKRHFRIGAVDRRRRRIQEVTAAVVAAAFQDGREAGEIGINIGEGIDQ